MIRGSLARRYARALMEIGQQEDKFDRLGEEIEKLAALARRDKDFGLVLKAPVISKDAREKVLAEVSRVMGFDETTERFLKLLNQKGRLPFLDQISEAYRDMRDEAEGKVRAEVISAVPLAAEAEDRVNKALSSITGKTVIMETKVDEDLIGGVVARVAGRLLDGSVRTQLKAFEDSLKKEGAAG